MTFSVHIKRYNADSEKVADGVPGKTALRLMGSYIAGKRHKADIHEVYAVGTYGVRYSWSDLRIKLDLVPAPRKTYTIRAVLDAECHAVEYQLWRNGHMIKSEPVTWPDAVTPVWKLRRYAESIGATHIRLPLSGTIEKV